MQSPHADVSSTTAWWQYGHVWLLISGPLIVVVACFVTAFIAIRYPDPVLAQDYYRRGLAINKTLAQEKALQLAPAMETRNHVITPKPEMARSQP